MLAVMLSARPVLHKEGASRPALRMALPAQGMPEVPFASSYKREELSALWSSLKKCYGSEALARQAVRQQPQVMCPVYASSSLLEQSRDALVVLLGKEEAVDIMLKNPMVLTCGGRELSASSPSEIRNVRDCRPIECTQARNL
ncbi:MAG: hypothetical protein SGPRY_004550, partial [Prymnesium sp.]